LILILSNLVRIANELRLAQHEGHCNELRDQISLVEADINQMLKQITPIDFAQIQQVCFVSSNFLQKKMSFFFFFF
jgi:tRNA1(Val) A37 N6-methylase TrmN6